MPESFPTPMEEPRKVMRALFLGAVQVDKPCGIDVIHGAIDQVSCTNNFFQCLDHFMKQNNSSGNLDEILHLLYDFGNTEVTENEVCCFSYSRTST